MIVQLESLGTTTVVLPEGRLDFGAAAAFEKQLTEALAGRGGVAPRTVILDGSGLEYVSSAGLRAILLAARGAQRSGVAFSLCALKPAVREVFDLSGFSRIIAVHPDRAAALAAAPPSGP
ncbi:MAG: STAS domain-containing protein [Proteobacteria bacterium]|nr:STAS domain-containing protein [Pseudomonadota bacterium]